jgi:hypothetical protein
MAPLPAARLHHRCYAGSLPAGLQVSNCKIDRGAVEVKGPNAPPAAQDQSYTTQEDTPLTKDAANGVLAGASDPNCDLLTAKVSKAPAHGSLSLVVDGSFTYTPAPDFSGADGFEFLVSDGAGGQALTKASITVGELLASLLPEGSGIYEILGTSSTGWGVPCLGRSTSARRSRGPTRCVWACLKRIWKMVTVW